MGRRSLRAVHWNEAKHPRDDRGRFARKGGGRWLAKVTKEVGARFGDISMGAHPDTPPRGGRLQTGKGHVIDTAAIARTAPLGVHGPAEAPDGRIGRTAAGRVTGTFEHGLRSATSSHPANAVATLSKGDHARVQGVDQYGKATTLNGHVQGVGKVRMGKRGSRTKQDMLAVQMAETPSGANGWRGTVYVKPDATAERTRPKAETTTSGEIVGGRLLSQSDLNDGLGEKYTRVALERVRGSVGKREDGQAAFAGSAGSTDWAQPRTLAHQPPGQGPTRRGRTPSGELASGPKPTSTSRREEIARAEAGADTSKVPHAAMAKRDDGQAAFAGSAGKTDWTQPNTGVDTSRVGRQAGGVTVTTGKPSTRTMTDGQLRDELRTADPARAAQIRKEMAARGMSAETAGPDPTRSLLPGQKRVSVSEFAFGMMTDKGFKGSKADRGIDANQAKVDRRNAKISSQYLDLYEKTSGEKSFSDLTQDQQDNVRLGLDIIRAQNPPGSELHTRADAVEANWVNGAASRVGRQAGGVTTTAKPKAVVTDEAGITDPADLARIRAALAEHGGGYYGGPLAMGKGDAARYTTEGHLKDLTAKYGHDAVQQAVAAEIARNPGVLDLKPGSPEHKAMLADRLAASQAASKRALAAVKAGDHDEAQRIIDQAELADPNYREGGFSWGDMRKYVGEQAPKLTEPSRTNTGPKADNAHGGNTGTVAEVFGPSGPSDALARETAPRTGRIPAGMVMPEPLKGSRITKVETIPGGEGGGTRITGTFPNGGERTVRTFSPDTRPVGRTSAGRVGGVRQTVSTSDAAERLQSASTREEGQAALEGMTVAELKDVARKLNVRRDQATKQELKDRIVERTVGSRINASVLRENVGTADVAPRVGRTPSGEQVTTPNRALDEALRVENARMNFGRGEASKKPDAGRRPDGSYKYTDYSKAGYDLGKLTVTEAGIPDKGAVHSQYQEMLRQINGIQRQGPARVGSKDQYYRPMTRKLEEAAQYVHEHEGNPDTVAKLRALADIHRPAGDVAPKLRSRADVQAEHDAIVRQREAMAAAETTKKSKGAYDKLLAADGKFAVQNPTVRKIVEQMEAHGWTLTGHDQQVDVLSAVAPDGRTLKIQFPGGKKPHITISDQYNAPTVTFKAALAHVVTPTHEESGKPSIRAAMDRLGMPDINSSDHTMRPLEDMQREMQQSLGGSYTYTDREITPEVLDRVTKRLRTAAASNRLIADQKAEYSRSFMSGSGEDASTELMRKRADQFEQVAAELEKMNTERGAYLAERERRANAPLDIRPGRSGVPPGVKVPDNPLREERAKKATAKAGPVPKVTGYAKGRELEPGMLVNAADLLPMHESQGNTTGENPNPLGHANWVRVGMVGNTNDPAYKSYNSNRSLTGGMYVVFDQAGHPVGRMSANTIAEVNTEQNQPEAKLDMLRTPVKVQVKVNDGFGKYHMEERDGFAPVLVPSAFAQREAGMPAPKLLSPGVLDPKDPNYGKGARRPAPANRPHGERVQGSRTREQHKADRAKRDQAYAASEPQRAARRAELEAQRKADAAAERERQRVEAEKAYEVRREQDRRDRLTRQHASILEDLADTNPQVYDRKLGTVRPATSPEEFAAYQLDRGSDLTALARAYGVKTRGVDRRDLAPHIVAAVKAGKQPDLEVDAPKVLTGVAAVEAEAKKIAMMDKRRRTAITKAIEELRAELASNDKHPMALEYASDNLLRQIAEAFGLEALTGHTLRVAIKDAVRDGRRPDLDAAPVTSLKKKR